MFNDSSIIKKEIADAVTTATRSGSEWASDAQIAESTAHPIDEVHAYLMVLAAEGFVEMDQQESGLCVRGIRQFEPVVTPQAARSELRLVDATASSLDVFADFLGQIRWIFPPLVAVGATCLSTFVLHSPNLWIDVLFGAAGFAAGMIVFKGLS